MTIQKRERIEVTAFVLFIAVVLAFITINSMRGWAADKDAVRYIHLGQTVRERYVDLGDHDALATYSESRDYYTTSGLYFGNTLFRWIMVPLDSTSTDYQHGSDGDYLVVRNYDYVAYLDGNTGTYFYSLGVVESQNGATSGTVAFFFTTVLKGSGKDSMRRMPFPDSDEMKLKITNDMVKITTNENDTILGRETNAAYAVGATLGAADGTTITVDVGDIIGRIYVINATNIYYLIPIVQYRAITE